MANADFPRVAIVSVNPISSEQCNGILMRSLFQGWPRERLAQLYFPTLDIWKPDTAVCAEYRSIRAWGRVHRHSEVSLKQAQGSPSVSPFQILGSNAVVRRALTSITRSRRLMSWLRPCAELWSANFPLCRILERQLSELRPDCVYALLGNYHLTKSTYLACSRLNLPLFSHVTDDFVTAQYRDIHFSSTLQSLSDRWFRRAVGYSRGLAAISPIMADEFQKRYEKPWSWFTTGVDPQGYNPTPRQPDGTLRLVYSGNLGLERWKALRVLALALHSLAQGDIPPVRLAIYAPEDQLRLHQAALMVLPIVELCGWKRPQELPQLFHDADMLVHVESNDPTIAAYTRFSFSTKLSQYMMAGRCILGVGPAEAGSLKMISQTGAGIVTGEMEPTALARVIAPVLSDHAQQKALGEQGRQWALQWCDRAEAQERLRRELVAIVRRSRLDDSSPRIAG